MASAWTLGRVGLDVETMSGDAPESFKVSGNEIKFSGVVRSASLSDSKSLRTQLLGLVNNPDQPWVPFTFPGDPYAWDSFVRVDDVTVGMIPTSLTGAGWFPFEVELTMLSNAAHAPVIESRVLGALRTNSHGIAVGSTVPWWGVPSDATMDFRGLGAGGVSYVSATRTSDTGGVRIIYTTSGALMYDDAFTWQCAPGDFYDGSAKVRRCLGLVDEGDANKKMSIVVEQDGELYSLIIDSVGDLLALENAEFEQNPPTLDLLWRSVSLGVYRLDGNLLIILDIAKLLHSLNRPN